MSSGGGTTAESWAGPRPVPRRRSARSDVCPVVASCSVTLRHVNVINMDFQSAMETFAEAWAAANTVKTEAAELVQVSASGNRG